jgi:hypothetical protein
VSEEQEPWVKPGKLLSTILHDIHFWIPLVVLLAGLFLLHNLR